MVPACQSCIRRDFGLRRIGLFALTVLTFCFFHSSPVVAQITSAEVQGSSQPVLLTNVQQVLKLGPYRARQFPHPTRITGVIISFNPNGLGFLHDGTACILISLTNNPGGLTRGKLAEVEGWTESGLQAPMVGRAQARVLGEAPIPAPIKLAVARMKSGEGCWQWVRIEAVVRDMNRDKPNLALSVAAEGERFSVFIYGYEKFSPRGLPLDWLEARLLIDGICWTDVNDRNQVFDFHLALTDTNQLHFLRPGATNLFNQPLLGLPDAGRLRVATDDRLKISGNVLALVGNDLLFLRTEFGPIQARLFYPISRGMPTTELVPRLLPESLQAGDRVELVGAPTETSFAPRLLDVEYRRIAKGAPPEATHASRRDLTSGKYDADLIRVVGRLLSHERRQRGARIEEALVLETGETVFEATLETERTNVLSSLPFNSRLELNGICLVQPGPGNLRHTFKMLLRQPSDLRYLGRAPFWSTAGTGRILAVGSGLVAATGLWVLLLRRKVRERTAELAAANFRLSGEVEERQKAQNELKNALASERELGELKNRFVSLVSHEFRTPLGITMSAVELLRNYMERLSPEKLKELLDDIYSSTLRMSGLMEQVLLLGRVEARKMALKPACLDLEAFCHKLVDETHSATNHKCPVHFSIQGDFSRAKADESLLRHIFSNLLSNAIKYSPESSVVDFKIEREGNDAVFCVSDRGIGIPGEDQPRLFEAFHRGANVGQITGTGLGLLIVKRCVEMHQGSIHFESQEGKGAAFIVRLPLFL
jgi:signal transduction histidine kinase